MLSWLLCVCVCVCWNLSSNSRTHKLALDILLDLRIEIYIYIYYTDSQLVENSNSNNKKRFFKTNTNWVCFAHIFVSFSKIYGRYAQEWTQHICLFVYIFWICNTRKTMSVYIYEYTILYIYKRAALSCCELLWVFVVRSGISKRNKHFRIARNAARDWDSDRDWVDFQSASTSATSERNGTRANSYT